MGKVKNQFQIISTPNPNEEAFYTDLDQEVLSNFRTGEWPRTIDSGSQTLYQAWRYALPERVKQGWGDYAYTSKQPIGEGGMRFFWAKNKNDEDKNTPFRSYTEVKNHRWSPILLAFGIQQDYTFPNSTNVISGNDVGIVTAPRNYPKYVYIPEVNEGSRFVIEEFFAATKFDIPQTPVPTATAVQVNMLDVTLSFPESLHPKIVIPNTRTGLTQVIAGVAGEAGGGINGQVFPATNFETWAPYIMTDQQEFTETGWHRIRVRVYPPALPDAIVR